MLTEINCILFSNGPIVFKDGLNVVLGDPQSTNSIGKSTLLMIIDFAFGGETYITKNSGSIKELEHHAINFKFKFDDIEFYFSRSTDTDNDVYICNNNYASEKKISVKEFTAFLKKAYNLEIPDLSFRSITSLYSRIWGKENDNVSKPLQSYLKEPEPDSVYNLIKLFNKYSPIAQTSLSIKENSESKKVIDGVFKQNYVKKVTKNEFKQNSLKIEQLNNQKKVINDNLLQFTLNTEVLTNKDMLELKIEKNKLLESLNLIETKIKRIDINLNNTSSIKSKHLNLLSTFFKDVNLEKIEKIEAFHNKISTILKKELKESKKRLESKEEIVKTEVNKVDEKITHLLKGVDSPKFIIEKIYDITIDANKLETENKFFEEKEKYVTKLSELKTKLGEIITTILNEIELSINNHLSVINLDILGENKKSPKIHLKESRYNYDHFNNTGTGKLYVDLIIFDLTIAEITQLPFLIHDSFLYKNIEDFSVDKIMKKYTEMTKQIFISIDGTSRYNVETNQIIQKCTAIELTNSKLLFTKDWR